MPARLARSQQVRDDLRSARSGPSAPPRRRLCVESGELRRADNPQWVRHHRPQVNSRQSPVALTKHSSIRASCADQIAHGNGQYQECQASCGQRRRRVEADQSPIEYRLLGCKDVRSFAVVEHPRAQAFHHFGRSHQATPADQGRDGESCQRLQPRPTAAWGIRPTRHALAAPAKVKQLPKK